MITKGSEDYEEERIRFFQITKWRRELWSDNDLLQEAGLTLSSFLSSFEDVIPHVACKVYDVLALRHAMIVAAIDYVRTNPGDFEEYLRTKYAETGATPIEQLAEYVEDAKREAARL